ncbi:AEC family transporter [Vibrio agarivorans]|uniref:AEC family transporter n=1 Tax=Vibrio agarivorans TaxID=153622 RepID=UPI0025B2BA38|nr:AEC family transporter [Vibrio agarivorans]MDN3660855.1 AEC family transporter [Vibrio agarivorans]
MLEQLLFSASVTGPICLMLVLGVFLKRIGMIHDAFIESASKLVFQITLPTMLFLSIVNGNFDLAGSGKLILFGLFINTLVFVATIFITRIALPNHQDHGVIVQGGFRANTAIIALAYMAKLYGEEGIAISALYVATTTILYNIQAVFILTPKGSSNGGMATVVDMTKNITKNPLIIGIMCGVVAKLIALPVPKMVLDTGGYFANMTLPLALLCTGGSLNLSALKHDQKPTVFATTIKLVIAPIMVTAAAYLFGYRDIELGLFFMMSAAPTAAASYVMARSMGGNSTLAANIIALTTVASIITCTLGIFILTNLQLI